MLSEKEREEEAIEFVLGEAIRFGAAIGSWHNSKILWQQMAGAECIDIIRKKALFEIKSQIREIANDVCHKCGQKNPDK